MSNKFKLAIENTKKVYGDVFARYPVSTILVFISTIYASIYVILEEKNVFFHTVSQAILWWLLFFVYSTVGAFGIEALPEKFFETNKKIKKTVGILIMVIISGILVSVTLGLVLGIAESETLKHINDHSLLAWNMAYFVLIFLCVFYCRYKDGKNKIEKYFVSVFTGAIEIGIVWVILALGILILTAIFDSLITRVEFSGYFVPQLLIGGLYVTPCFMMTLTNVKDELGRFFETLIKYVLLILTIIGAAIIYIYIVKTIITGIPSNEIFSIASALFFVAVPVGFSCTAYNKDSFLQKIAYALPYIYAPFIILQAYSIFTRINEYGITPSRYMGVVLIVLEVIYTLVYAFARKHIDKVILVMMAVTVVVTLIPGINVNATSERSQKATIVKFIKNGLPSNYKEQERLKGAYFYLRDEFGDDYMEKLLDSDDIEELRTLDDRINNEEPREYSLHSDIPFVDAKGYDYVAKFQNSYYMQDYPDENIDCSALELSVDGKVLCTIDYTDEVDSIIKRASKDERYRIEGADVMKVSDDCELVITYAEIDKDLVTDKIFHVQFNGYIKFNETFFDVRRFEEE